MIRCGGVEDVEDKICCFYGGLRHDIQDVMGYKDFTIVNHQFQLSMLAEKELQGCQQRGKSSFINSFTPKTTTSSLTKTSRTSS